MGVLYWREEIEKMMNDKLNDYVKELIVSTSLSEETVICTIRNARFCKKFINWIVSDMKEADRKYEEAKKGIKNNEERAV